MDTIKWAKLLKEIYQNSTAICPDCGGKVEGVVYSNDGKVGFAVLECKSCKEHIKFSRIKIPNNVTTKTY